jgi:O-antigen/teichoic acid export membrane protein
VLACICQRITEQIHLDAELHRSRRFNGAAFTKSCVRIEERAGMASLLNGRFASGLRWMAAGRLSAQLVSWVGTIFVMRLLTPADYGLAAICAAIVSAVSMVAEFGLGAGLVQARTLARDQVRSVFGASLLFSLVAVLLVVGAAPVLGWFFRAPEVVLLVQVSSLQLLLSPLATIPEAFLKREMAFRGASIIELVAGVAASAGTVALAWYGFGVWALVLGPLMGVFLRVLLLNVLAPQRLWPSFRFAPARGLIDFGFKVALSRIAGYVFAQSDVLIAARVLDKSALGVYSVAMHLAMLPVTKIMGIVNHVAYPAIAELSRNGHDVRPYLLRGLRLFAYALVPLLWGLAAVAPWLIPVVLGPSWVTAVLPLQIVCVALPLRLISVLMSTAIQGLGHAGIDLANTVTGMVLLPLCFLVGVQFGVVGLAGAWLVGLPVLIVLNLRRASAVLQIGVRETLQAIAPPALCSAAMAALVVVSGEVLGLAAATAPGVLALVLVGALAYACILWFGDRSSARELLALLRP